MNPTLAEARARGISLPSDDDAAQAVIDEQAAWLARKVGPLWGERSETFYVGLAASHGKLGLRRYTDAVSVVDGSVTVDTAHYRLVDGGGAIHHTYSAASQWWTGPYVVVTYVPNDEDEVRRVLFGLIALEATPPSVMNSERIGDYSYTRGLPGTPSVESQKAALASSLVPKRDQATTLHSARSVSYGDPVINRPEPVW